MYCTVDTIDKWVPLRWILFLLRLNDNAYEVSSITLVVAVVVLARAHDGALDPYL